MHCFCYFTITNEIFNFITFVTYLPRIEDLEVLMNNMLVIQCLNIFIAFNSFLLLLMYLSYLVKCSLVC